MRWIALHPPVRPHYPICQRNPPPACTGLVPLPGFLPLQAFSPFPVFYPFPAQRHHQSRTPLPTNGAAVTFPSLSSTRQSGIAQQPSAVRGGVHHFAETPSSQARQSRTGRATDPAPSSPPCLTSTPVSRPRGAGTKSSVYRELKAWEMTDLAWSAPTIELAGSLDLPELLTEDTARQTGPCRLHDRHGTTIRVRPESQRHRRTGRIVRVRPVQRPPLPLHARPVCRGCRRGMCSPRMILPSPASGRPS